MTLSARDRRAILLGGVGLGVMLMCHQVVLPAWEAWTDARRRTANARDQLAGLHRDLVRVIALRGRLEKQFGACAFKPLPDVEAARVRLFGQAEAAMNSGGFGASEYQPQSARAVRELSGVYWVRLQVRGSCDVGGLSRSLAALRGLEIPVVVKQMSVQNSTKEPGTLSVTLVLATLAGREGVER
jgi:hypothetical protein